MSDKTEPRRFPRSACVGSSLAARKRALIGLPPAWTGYWLSPREGANP